MKYSNFFRWLWGSDYTPRKTIKLKLSSSTTHHLYRRNIPINKVLNCTFLYPHSKVRAVFTPYVSKAADGSLSGSNCKLSEAHFNMFELNSVLFHALGDLIPFWGPFKNEGSIKNKNFSLKFEMKMFCMPPAQIHTL